MWRKCEHNILRILHKFKANDLAMFIDLFDRDYLDSEGEAYMKFTRASDVFF